MGMKGSENMVFDYSKIKGKIKEVFGTQRSFAKAMNMSEQTLSDKLNNKIQFTQNEIILACKLLKIDPENISLYFFMRKVKEL